MNKLVLSLCLAGAMALPALADARPVTLTTQMKAHGGDGAYLAIYVTDAAGKYHKTLWVSGKKSKYYKNLRDWARGSGMRASEFDGVSGASVGSGRTLKVTAELEDALIDAGYEIRIDTAVEDGRDNPADVRAPLTKAGSGKATAGRGYVQSFTYDM
ncbi:MULTISPECIES: DUF2271 domain-containing protein [Lysobacteraceae]|uniref:DUF2271 domain-containing protein n=2 Tax=Novilysobacter TaxID=3382699 RepID=A0A7S6ZRA6_9GAMM|nr:MULTISPECIES: DUF2271 domain-containing protein [Lysobacter]QOW18512.1 DUF2271 domain-containing protein [Lysobacter ciconiae]QOW20989.1 DUF2271 domain-containing protein [Lysobacter avium]QOW23484.1 DUF2271 domain-containing protein [Lysobacter sp. H23M47]